MYLVESCHHTPRLTTLVKLLNRDGKKLISGHFQFSRKAFHLFKKGIAQRDFYLHCHLSSPQWLSQANWSFLKLSVHQAEARSPV